MTAFTPTEILSLVMAFCSGTSTAFTRLSTLLKHGNNDSPTRLFYAGKSTHKEHDPSLILINLSNDREKNYYRKDCKGECDVHIDNLPRDFEFREFRQEFTAV